MKIIHQSYDFIDRDCDPLQMIERCGRLCYKTEEKITKDSAEPFVEMLVRKKHWAMIEHATVALEIPAICYSEIWNSFHSEDFNFIWVDKNHDAFEEPVCVISGNLRALNEVLSRFHSIHDCYTFQGIAELYNYLKFHYPVVFGPAGGGITFTKESYESVKPLRKNHPADPGYWDLFTTFRTVKFITNRGITHEIVRHRPASYAQESTRYVNYGGKEMEFINPVWCPDNMNELWNEREPMSFDDYAFANACSRAESQYNYLVTSGWRPEQAREVLPNSLKTEIIVTANLKEWQHILTLRTANAAHPQMRALMRPLLDNFKKEFPRHFKHTNY